VAFRRIKHAPLSALPLTALGFAPIWLIAQLGGLQTPENVAPSGNLEKGLPIRLRP